MSSFSLLNREMKKVFRPLFRFVLGSFVRWTMHKHKPTVICITGDGETSIMREAIFSVIKEFLPARRNVELPEAEFSVPLTILGFDSYPHKLWQWGVLIVKMVVQALWISRTKHALILELQPLSQKVFDFWLQLLVPQILVLVGDNDMKVNVSAMSEVLTSASGLESARQMATIIGEKLGMDKLDIELGLESISFPEARLRILSSVTGALIIDATHYYFPIKLNAVLEVTEGYADRNKIALCPIASESGTLSALGWKVNPVNHELKDTDMVLLRGSRSHYWHKYSQMLQLNNY